MSSKIDELRSLTQKLNETETALQQSEALFRAIFRAAPDGVLVVRPDGTIYKANLAAEKLFGKSKEELCGTSVDDYVDEDFKEQHIKLRKEYFESPSKRLMAACVSAQIKRNDGSQTLVNIALGPIQINGVNGVIAILRNNDTD